MKISWVTLDRFCQDEAQVNEGIRRMIERSGRRCAPPPSP